MPACVVLAAGLLALAGATRADRVYFKNGRSIEGVIREERDDAVVLGLGLGSMTIKRSQIDRVERDEGAANEDRRNEWRERHYLHEKYVPQGLEPLAAAFRDLRAARDDAVKANRALSQANKEELVLNGMTMEVTKERQSVSEEIAASASRPKRNVRAYNALVARHNTLAAEAALLRGKLQANDERRQEASRTISTYVNALLSFRRQFDEADGKRPVAERDEATHYLLEQVAKQLNEYESAFLDPEAEISRRGNSTFVQAVVNGKRRGRFLVDTGATLVALSSSFARDLGLRTGSFPEAEVVVADGRQVKAKLTLLQSVRVGRTTIENVKAVVMPGEVGEDIDGLLGMSCLRHFNVTLGGAGNLQLKRFSPE